MMLTADRSAEGLIPRQRISLPMRVSARLARSVRAKPRTLRNATPLLSFTFDDVPRSSVCDGARVMERYGVRGTFYVATGLLGRATPDWRLAEPAEIADVAARGHEIGLHTHAHRPVAFMGRAAFAEDLRTSRDLLSAHVPGTRLENFAFPFGFSSWMHRGFLNGAVRSSRTTHPGLNAGEVDIQALRSWALGDALSATNQIDRRLDEAVAANGWLILTGHDVADTPSPYGCTAAFLAHCIEGALARGIRIAPVSTALDLCGVPS